MLDKQTVTRDNRRRRSEPHVKRTFTAQMSDMGCPNHDLGGNATHVDAGAADSPALDQRDPGTVFRRFERSRHSGSAATDNRHM